MYMIGQTDCIVYAIQVNSISYKTKTTKEDTECEVFVATTF
jgi:hypothetical protein